MSEPSSVVPSGRPPASPYLYPSTLILLAANLVPFAGILFWGWDAFVLLALYWMETAVIGFWMILRIATAPRGSLGRMGEDGQGSDSPLALCLFFIVHGGLFMTVHFVFLWTLFSGDWSRAIHGPVDFVTKLVIGTGLWLPLLVLFVARGAVFLYQTWGVPLIARLHGRPVVAAPVAPGSQAGTVFGGFYTRVVIMHIAIIAGGFLAMLGTIAPLIILILLKTAVDLWVHVAFDLGDGRKAFKALFGARA